MANYHTLVLDIDTSRPIFVDKNGSLSAEAEDGTDVRFNYLRPFDQKAANIEESVLIRRLPSTCLLPERRISSMSTGKAEEFLVSMGFASQDIAPEDPTIAVWFPLRGLKPLSNYEIMYGGPDFEICFKMGKWLGRDGRDAGNNDTLIMANQVASGIRFKRKSTVSDWQLFHEM